MFCGIDWSDTHHDVAIVDNEGGVVALERVGNDVAGFTRLTELLAEADQCAQTPAPVAIETTKGLFVAALVASGRTVYPINPLATSRYRDRHRSTRGKSDAADALVLANILRTDSHAHHRLPDNSELVLSLRVLTRAHQDAVGDRVRMTNRIRAVLKQFFPAALEAFERGGKQRLDSPACRTILADSPDPASASNLSVRRLRSLLRQAGRTRRIEAEAMKLKDLLHSEQLRQPKPVEVAMGKQLRCLVGHLNAICAAVEELADAIEVTLFEHQDTPILLSFPGAGTLTSARLLAEIGDDQNRFVDGRALKAYVGAAPITRSSGKSHWVGARKSKNNRLASTGYIWAMAAIRHDPAARAHYQQRRDHGDYHIAALRNLFNKLTGKLYHCLQTGQHYDPTIAFPTGTT